jgi:hypothetical protein
MIYGPSNTNNISFTNNSTSYHQNFSMESYNLHQNTQIKSEQNETFKRNESNDPTFDSSKINQELDSRPSISQYKNLRCPFLGCDKEYTNSSRREIHIRTHVTFYIKNFRLEKNHINAKFVPSVLMKKEI